MYAIIQTGGKQYRVESGDVLDVELDARGDGDAIEFRDVLLVSDESGTKIGEPKLENATVSAVSLGEIRAPKIIVFKKKRRKGYKRTNGHRQNLLRVRIDEISSGS